MKRRFLALTMGLVLGLSTVATGCSTGTATETTANNYAGETVYGEVTEVGDDSITLTLADVDDTASGDVTEDDLTLTDEELTVEVTDDTSIETASMGGGDMGSAPSDMGGASGDAGQGGEAPSDMPSGDDSSDGEAPSDSQPSDDESDSQTYSDSDSDSDSEPVLTEGGSDEEGAGGEGGEAPDGGMASGDAGSAPSDMGGSASGDTSGLSSISEGDYVAVTFDEDGNATTIQVLSSSQEGGMDMSSSSSSSGVDSYDAVTEYTEDTEVSGQSYESTGTDENAIHVYNAATVLLSDITVSRDSDNSTGGDNSSFYGVGAAILNTEGTLYVSAAEITTDAAGGAGIFSYGDGVTYVADSTITTEQDTSGGIHVAGGGTLYAWDCDVETNGQSSAAVRSDRGSGTMVVDGGSYTSNGVGSPAVYSTADITINDADLTANGSEAVCIEGLNSLRLFDCNLTGNMSDDDQNDCTWTVILYQSMSGDSEDGNSSFEMVGGTLTSENGGVFYTTNTESTFTLDNVDINYNDDNEFFLMCTGNNNERGWGTVGENGADCNFTAIEQEMEGDIIWDSVSELDFYMTEGSTLTGAIVDDETNAGNGGSGYASLYIDEDSTWVVTGDSELTNLYNEGTIVDEDGNTVSIVGTDGTTYVEGTSDYTITVDNYSTSADFSGASSADSFSDYEVERPDEL